MQDIYKVETHPLALSENMITGDKYRITFLTEGLIRLEYDEEGVFEDRPTQMVFFRDFPKADYRVVRTEDGIEVHTKRIHLIYNEKEFTSWGLSIQVKGNLSAYHSIWHYGEEIHDLKGTARTLDMVDGATELEHGILSRFGYSLVDDSRSQVLLPDGGSSQEERASRICTSSDTDMTTKKHFMIFTDSAEKHRCFQGLLSETGGADIINILKKATMS